MITEVKIPSPGESILEVEIGKWLVKNGDFVKKGQIIAELESDKVTLELTASVSGYIYLLAKSGDNVSVGSVVCKINSKKEKKDINICSFNNYKKDGDKVTVNDIINNKDYKETTKRKLSNIRRKISERLLETVNKTAMLTTFHEVDMSYIINIREKYQKKFIKMHNFKLGYMPFFVRASVESLKLFQNVNSTIINNEYQLIYKYYDINIAVSSEKGLSVPVINNANKMTIKKIEEKIKYLADLVRNNKINIKQMESGTFTITNGGVFGSMLSTPIINPPQSAILGMHNIYNRSVVIDNKIKIRPMMYLALSYDHRIIDGKEAIQFLLSIKNYIENPYTMLKDINNELEI